MYAHAQRLPYRHTYIQPVYHVSYITYINMYTQKQIDPSKQEIYKTDGEILSDDNHYKMNGYYTLLLQKVCKTSLSLLQIYLYIQ